MFVLFCSCGTFLPISPPIVDFRVSINTIYVISLSIQFMFYAYFINIMSLKMIIKKSKHVEVLMFELSSTYCSIVHFVVSCTIRIICKLSLQLYLLKSADVSYVKD